MLPHDERYAFGTEWLHVVRRLLTGERVSFQGKYFQIDDFGLVPHGTYRERPQIYLGGESSQARDLAAAETDVLFLNGQSQEAAATLIADVRRRPRPTGVPLRFGLAAFVVTAETDDEVEALMEEHWRYQALDRAGAQPTAGDRVSSTAASDRSHGRPTPRAEGMNAFEGTVDPDSPMWRRLLANPHVGPNGGTAAGLVGTYDTVAARILEWNELGIETFMLAFQPFESEMERFAAEIAPRVEALRAALV